MVNESLSAGREAFGKIISTTDFKDDYGESNLQTNLDESDGMFPCSDFPTGCTCNMHIHLLNSCSYTYLRAINCGQLVWGIYIVLGFF